MDTFCYLPWTHSSVRNDGTFRVCCQANVSNDKGELKDELGNTLSRFTSTPSEAANSQTLKNVRKAMMNNVWPDQCIRCKQEEEHNTMSRRLREEKSKDEMGYLDKSDLIAATHNDGTIDLTKAPVVSYELRLGNLCNLACAMCGPSDSDKWYDMHERIWGTKCETPDVKKLAWFKEESAFWDEFYSNVHNLKYLYIIGGEPLMTKRFYQILEYVVAADAAKNIVIDFNTNLTIVSPKLLSLLNEFKQVQIGVSIDGVGEVNDYIRYPSEWNTIASNLKQLDDAATDKFIIRLSATISAFNVFDIPNLIDWKMRSNFKHVNKFKSNPILTHHFCFEPKSSNMQLLPEDVKHSLDDHYASYLYRIRNYYPAHVYKSAEKILNSIMSYMMADDSADKNELRDYITRLDAARGTNILNIIPELSEFMEEV